MGQRSERQQPDFGRDRMTGKCRALVARLGSPPRRSLPRGHRPGDADYGTKLRDCSATPTWCPTARAIAATTATSTIARIPKASSPMPLRPFEGSIRRGPTFDLLGRNGTGPCHGSAPVGQVWQTETESTMGRWSRTPAGEGGSVWVSAFGGVAPRVGSLRCVAPRAVRIVTLGCPGLPQSSAAFRTGPHRPALSDRTIATAGWDVHARTVCRVDGLSRALGLTIAPLLGDGAVGSLAQKSSCVRVAHQPRHGQRSPSRTLPVGGFNGVNGSPAVRTARTIGEQSWAASVRFDTAKPRPSAER